MSNNPNEKAPAFDLLEFAAAVLLGLAAIATAFASFESGLYDGRMVESYSQSNRLSTESAAERSKAIVEMSKDNSVYVEGMKLTMEGDDAPNPAAEERTYYIATYLYCKYLSDPGYKALGLPPEARKQFDEVDETPGAEDKQTALQETVLEKAMEKDLTDDKNYAKEMLAKSQGLLDQSEKAFKEGQEANEIGDRFDLVTVLYAISLFFGGITQVFRNEKMRWAILGMGTLLFLGSSLFMFRLPLIFL